MPHVERISELIGDIYDAALDPALWPAVLEAVCAFVRGPSASLFSQDALRKTGNVHYTWGDNDHYRRLYFEKYIRLNPLTTPALFLEVGKVHAGSDLMPYDKLTATRFFREWVLPQGWGDLLFANLEKTATSYAVFSVVRHHRDGPADGTMRRRVGLLIPHVRRAVLIGKVIDLRTVEAAALADTLDGLAAGLFLVDATGRLVHANASGHAMLDRGDLVRAAGGRLAANDPAAEQALHEIFSAAGGGDAALGAKGIAVPVTARGGERFVAHVLPLTAGARRQAAVSHAAVAAVFVHQAALDLPSPIEAFAKAYGLTPGELRVLLAVVEVGGVPEVADVLGISAATVRTHLRRLFAKTGATRQVDLVKLVAGYANSLTG
jgi:DNA-binding CsgD family transcriptional regulator